MSRVSEKLTMTQSENTKPLSTPLANEGFNYAAPAQDTTKNVERLEVEKSWVGRAITEPKLPKSVILASLIINCLALITPLVILQIYDRIIPNISHATLWILFAGSCGLLFFDLALKSLRYYALGHSSSQYMHTMNVEAMSRILHAPFGMIEKQAVSTQLNRINALTHVAEFHGSQTRTTAIDMPFVIIFLSLMALVGGAIVLVPISLFAVFGLISISQNKKMNVALTERSNLDNRKFDFILEALSGMFTIKALGMESAIQRRYEKLQQNSAEGTYNQVKLGNSIQDLSVFFGSVAQIAVVGVGAVMTINNTMSMGALACCTLLSGQVLQPLLRGIVVWTDQQNLKLRRQTASELYELPFYDMSVSKQNITQSLSLKNVVLRNSSGTETLLNGASVEFPQDKIICIHTPSDQGRQSFLRMLKGEIAPQSGKVLVGEVDLHDANAQAMRSSISYVSSRTQMFRGTILENLTHFEISKNRAAAFEATRLLGLDDEINQLPEGFDTKIGEGISTEFGVGFMQKLAIARALVNSPSILLMDNITENLDPAALSQMQRTLDALRGRMTIIIASSDTRILAAADVIFALRDGLLQAARVANKPAQQALKSA